MAITRITQNMLTQHSLGSLQNGLGKLAHLQEQLSTGKTINRPSDNPAGAASAMRLRDTLAATQQYQRNADDGLAWLGVTDSAITSLTDQARTARDAGLQAANDGALPQSALDALADTVDGLRQGIIGTANTTYLGRPVFGGVTGGSTAYDASGAYVGTPGTVDRPVSEGVSVRVDTDGRSVLGPPGDSVLDHLTQLSAALRSGDTTGVRTLTDKVAPDLDVRAAAHAVVGTRYQRVEAAQAKGLDDVTRLKASLSTVEDADLPEVIVGLQVQQTAYQAALSSTAKVLQPTLMDFLR